MMMTMKYGHHLAVASWIIRDRLKARSLHEIPPCHLVYTHSVYKRAREICEKEEKEKRGKKTFVRSTDTDNARCAFRRIK